VKTNSRTGRALDELDKVRGDAERRRATVRKVKVHVVQTGLSARVRMDEMGWEMRWMGDQRMK
jgi:hypothetical protein